MTDKGLQQKIAELIAPKSWEALRMGNLSPAHRDRRTSSLRKAEKILTLIRSEMP